jgi:hypothetical protein
MTSEAFFFIDRLVLFNSKQWMGLREGSWKVLKGTRKRMSHPVKYLNNPINEWT